MSESTSQKMGGDSVLPMPFESGKYVSEAVGPERCRL